MPKPLVFREDLFQPVEPPFLVDSPVEFRNELDARLARCISEHIGKTFDEVRVVAVGVVVEFVREKMELGQLHLNPLLGDIREDLFNPGNWVLGQSVVDKNIIFVKYVSPGEGIDA